MKFLKYRRDVVAHWPDSARKSVFLNGIESRINTMQRQLYMAHVAAERQEPPMGRTACSVSERKQPELVQALHQSTVHTD